jgi:hypothetical protein
MDKLWYKFTNKKWFAIKEYNFDIHNKTKPLIPTNNLDKIKKNSINPSVAVTGALEGSLIEGFGENSKGGLLKIHYHSFEYENNKITFEKTRLFEKRHVFSSCKKIVEGIINNNDYNSILINKLTQDNFKNLNDSKKLENLIKYSDNYPNHRNIGGNDKHWRIQVLRLPNKMVENMYNEFGEKSNEIIDIIIKKDFPYWYIHDLVSLDTNLGVMSSKKQLMTFRRSCWRVVNLKINNNFNEIVETIENNGDIFVLNNLKYKYNNKFIVKNIGIKIKNCNKTSKDIYYFIEKLLNLKKKEVLNKIEELDRIDNIKLIGVNVYKSLLQKLIRFQPINCKLPNSFLINSKIVLVYVMYKLLNSSPQYLPSLHRSVQGPENLSKRLGVIAFEDSNPEIIENIHFLFCIALLSQKIPLWYPSDLLIIKIFKIGLDLQNTDKAIEYKTGMDNFLNFDNYDSMNKYEKSAILLRIIGSFEGDIQMIEYISKERKFISNKDRPNIMLYPQHAFDQHVKPNMVLLLPDNIKYPKSKTIFGGRTSEIFNKCTSINPRRTNKWKNFEKDDFIKIIQNCQNDYYKLITINYSIKQSNNKKKFTFEMSDEWIAGLLGVFLLGKITVIRNKKKLSCVMTASLNPYDIKKIIITPKSSVRGNFENIKYAFDKDIQNSSLKKAIKILKSGSLRLNKISKKCLPISIYNWFVRKNNNYFEISNDKKKWIKYDNFKTWYEHFSINKKSINLNINKVNLFQNYNGISSDEQIIKLINSYNLDTLKRALTYIKHYKTSFKMNIVSRNGGTGDGSDQVSIHDSNVFKLFLNLSFMNPYALRPSISNPFEFTVEKIFMLKYLREIIESHIKKNDNTNNNELWYTTKIYEDKYKRKLFDFQKESINRMLKDKLNGKTRHFMNIKVGLGKTLIVLTYLVKRKLNDIEYIIYTMPKSAFGSVIDEMTSMNFNINIFSNSKIIDNKWKESLENTGSNQVTVHKLDNKVKFVKGTINVIEHDGLRKYKERIIDISSKSIFIIDEVHKCLPKGTKRSSAALEISKLTLETIAFTGTPIINTQGAKLLINWLEQNVDFNVNIENFQVATNSMVSYSVKTDVIVENIIIKAEFDKKELTEYENKKSEEDIFQMISICEKICNKKIIETVINKFKNKTKVFLVAKNKEHQIYFANILKNKISNCKIVCIGFKNKENNEYDLLPFINLTDKSVKNGGKDYDIVITRQSYSTGYNLTRISCMITSVYFSSEPTREQLRGRINRLDQNSSKVTYITVMTGLLQLIYNNYEKVKIVSKCLQTKKINNDDLIKLKNIL